MKAAFLITVFALATASVSYASDFSDLSCQMVESSQGVIVCANAEGEMHPFVACPHDVCPGPAPRPVPPLPCNGPHHCDDSASLPQQ